MGAAAAPFHGCLNRDDIDLQGVRHEISAPHVPTLGSQRCRGPGRVEDRKCVNLVDAAPLLASAGHRVIVPYPTRERRTKVAV
jgi:hypothetical protein